jgi:ribosomal-protein-alanine N-acetyltransferase
MALTLRWLIGRTGPPLRQGRVLLVEPQLRHYEAWSLLRETSRRHLEPFEPAWAPDELSRPAFRRRLRRYRSDRRWGSGAAYLVERPADGTLLGGVTLTNIRRGVTQSASVGYWIGLPYIRQGYASDALAGMLRHAFEDLELNRVEAACMPSNHASLAVLERAGFRREGLARRYLRINGVFEDHLLLARLRDDAPAVTLAREAIAEAASARIGAAAFRADGGQRSDATGQASITSAAGGHAA